MSLCAKHTAIAEFLEVLLLFDEVGNSGSGRTK